MQMGIPFPTVKETLKAIGGFALVFSLIYVAWNLFAKAGNWE